MNHREFHPLRSLFILLMAGLFLLSIRVSPAHATNAVVGTGTPSSCTEDAFTNALNSVEGGGGGVITFNCGGPATITFETSKIINSPAVTIDGGGSVILSGINKTRHFYVEGNAALELRNITLTKGLDTTYGGGAVLSLGELALDNATIRDSNVDSNHSGGAIMSLGPVTINDSLIENNTGGSAGGLFLFGEAADGTITNSTFRNNRTTSTAYGLGGAITTWNGADLTVRGATLDQNTAVKGGAIYNESAATTITIEADSLITGNEATHSNGGGIFNTGGSMGLTDVILAENRCYILGGGIYNASGLLNATNIVFRNNSCLGFFAGYGAGLYNTGGTASLTHAVFSGNRALEGYETSASGGGIANAMNGSLTLRNSTLTNNSARFGGGIENTGTLTLFNVTISKNSALGGGGLFNQGSSNLTHVTFSENYSGIVQQGGVLSLKNVLLNRSTAYNCFVLAGAPGLTSAGFNLSSDNSCAFNQTGDRVNVDPRLGPLADNGGFTRTYMLLPDSPAIDAGQCVSNLPTDQRGLPRLQGASCDIGAVERQPDDDEGGYSLFLPVVLK